MSMHRVVCELSVTRRKQQRTRELSVPVRVIFRTPPLATTEPSANAEFFRRRQVNTDVNVYIYDLLATSELDFDNSRGSRPPAKGVNHLEIP